MEGDTLIGLHHYRLIRSVHTWNNTLVAGTVVSSSNSFNDQGYIGALREDSLKIYFYSFINDDSPLCAYISGDTLFPAGSETLLYDFNLTPGDTVFWGAYERVVSSIDSILLHDGSYSNRINFVQEHGEDYWIEGIGSRLGLFGAYNFPPFEGGCTLSCFHKDSIYLHGQYSDPQACDGILSSPQVIAEIENIRIYPNPTKGALNMEIIDHSTAQLHLEVFNQFGQKIEEKILYSRTSSLSLEKYSSGLYFIQFKKEGKLVASKKVLLTK